MICKLVFLATIASLASAWTDFHALDPHHKSVELPDDRIHSSHDVHHVFPEHGSFFKCKYDAVHHKKWHFVEVNNHIDDFLGQVDCGSSEQELLIRNPSEQLKAQLAKQNYEWTVLTAHQKYSCDGEPIFRGVTGATHHADTDVLQVHTVQLRYENVFEHLDFRMETDHFEGQVEDLSDTIAENEMYLPSSDEASAIEEAEPTTVRGTAARGMETQRWSFKKAWKKGKKAVSKVVQKGKSFVNKLTTSVTQGLNKLKNFASKLTSLDKTKVIPLKTLEYNKDVTRSFSRWNFNGAVRLAASASAKPALTFRIKVQTLRLTLAEAYIGATYKGGVRVAFSSTTSYDNKAEKQLSMINLQTITFKITDAIPVTLAMTVPITAKYDIDVDGRMNFNFLLAAEGSIKLGLRYTSSRSFQVINEQRFSKTRDFSPRTFKYEVGLQASVATTFKATMGSVGFVQSTVAINAAGLMQSDAGKCKMLLQMTLQPVIVAQGSFDIKAMGRSLIKRSFGPKSLVSWKMPVINYCIPKTRFSRWGNRFSRRSTHNMLTQEAMSKSEDQPVNEHGVDITKPEDMGDNNTGTTWFGEIGCSSEGSDLEERLQWSMQFLPGEFYNETNGASSTQIILTLNHNKSQSLEEDDYKMTNLQRTYAMNDTLKAGFEGTIFLHQEVEEDQYDASTNDTSDIIINEKIQIKVDSEDATEIYVSAESMFCASGFLRMYSAEYNDDNTTFQTFHNGGGAPEQSLYEKLKAYAIYVPIICVVVLAVVVIVLVVGKRRKNAAHGANWAKSSHDVEPIMASDPAAAPGQGHVQMSHVAPPPTQDNRMSAL